MKQVILLWICATFSMIAQQKNVGDFNKITAFDQIDVMLIPSRENKVVLQGKGSKEVELINKNGELKIRMPLTKMLSGDNISATVYYTNLEAVEANEGSRIAGEAAVVANHFDIIAKEGASVDLTLEVDQLEARVTNGSKVKLQGIATGQDVLINSGGIYHASNLKTAQTTITANAGGEAEINASESVDAKVRAGGDIVIYGHPKEINQKVIAGGKIYEKED
ncbi:DUF2807 domain-containing protein [Flavobacterium sp. CYK-4]|uniref:head GIN domain-containing protein n=1 Tax=Flavobacterium lotistagni TaxID=2709660 RepID=UPI00140DACD7|nr:head GIN domain-containing protein [Flavobacterium lotistagni]NHM06130.1 DUF2807 domain-containing protein [Flavobacterium lotistagni]